MNESEIKPYDPNKCAPLIMGSMGIKGRKQVELAKKVGISRLYLNLFLNRRVNLLPEDLEAVLKELNLQDIAYRISTTAEVKG